MAPTGNGRLHAETQDGERVADRAALRALHDDWLLANAAEARGRPSPNAAQSVGLILSMPPGTPPDRVQAAARTWARETFGGTHDYLMVRHDDTKHPHVHVTVRAVGIDGKRLAPGPADLQLWRERFARELRRLGVEAEATPRQARGIVHKAARSAIQRTEARDGVPRVRAAERQEAERDATAAQPPQPRDWSRDIQARQEAIRRAYLTHAGELAQGDAADCRLAKDIQRFVADMPVPLTRRQALAVELRKMLDQHPGRGTPTRTEGPREDGDTLHRAKPSLPTPNPPTQDSATKHRQR
ncbi:relaxase/mobilization nuclease domain-containing protein [Methylobacterium radiotolerans]|uniref:relaxase/mobilization nuclease domain-containing protein n=1 Tax=Methylobacterium radiotolerans TaxID=31998 RepID=UPI0015F5E818|nr:relaxase/mobilization nuclease domain-containing protein [Methylobacterium radiotolerans]